MIAKVVKHTNLKNTKTDLEFWLSRSAEERLRTVEEIRCEFHGWKDHVQPRLQRVFTIVKRT
jgi:hypothetical protein